MISPQSVIEVYNILKSFKEQYDEYAKEVEETEIALKMLTQLMEDRTKIATINDEGSVTNELRQVFDQLHRCLLDFQVSMNGSSNRSLDTKKRIVAFARKAFTVAAAKGKAEELKKYTSRLKNILQMVELETSTAQARSLSVMAGQGATDLMKSTINPAKKFWTDNFLSHLSVPSTSFLHALHVEHGFTLKTYFGDQLDDFYRGVISMLDRDGDGDIDVREYSKFVNCDGYKEMGIVPKTFLDLLIASVTLFRGPSKGALSTFLMGGHTKLVSILKVLSKQFFCSGDVGGDVKVWATGSLVNGLEQISAIRTGTSIVTALALLHVPQVNTVVLGCADGTLQLVDIFSARVVGSLRKHATAINLLATSAVVGTANKRQKQQAALQENPAWDVDFNASLVFVVPRDSNEIFVHDAHESSRKVAAVLHGHAGTVTSIEYRLVPSRAVPILFSGSKDGEVRMWCGTTLRCDHVFSVGKSMQIIKLSCQSSFVPNAPDGHWQGDDLLLYVFSEHNSMLHQQIGVHKISLATELTEATDIDPLIFSYPGCRGLTIARRPVRIFKNNENQRITLFDASTFWLLFAIEHNEHQSHRHSKDQANAVLVWLPTNYIFFDEDDGTALTCLGEGDLKSSPSRAVFRKPKVQADGSVALWCQSETPGSGETESSSTLGGDVPKGAHLTVNDRGELEVLAVMNRVTNKREQDRIPLDHPVSVMAVVGNDYITWADAGGSIHRLAVSECKSCPGNHELKLSVLAQDSATTKPLRCAICMVAVAKGGTMRCEPCDFDACFKCWQLGRTAQRGRLNAQLFYSALGLCPLCTSSDCRLARCKAAAVQGIGTQKLCVVCLKKVARREQVGIPTPHLSAEGISSFFACTVCHATVCSQCRLHGIRKDAHRVATMNESAADFELSKEPHNVVVNDDVVEPQRPRLCIFSGKGFWTGHAHFNPTRDSCGGSMSVAMTSRLGFESCFGGRTVYKWSHSGRFGGAVHVIERDFSLEGGWKYRSHAERVEFGESALPVVSFEPHPLTKAAGKTLAERNFERTKPVLTVMTAGILKIPVPGSPKPIEKQVKALGTDFGHVGFYDSGDNLLMEFQLLETTVVCCEMCNKRLRSLQERLAGLCELCVASQPSRQKVSVSIIATPHGKRFRGWIPPSWVASCIPFLGGWKQVDVTVEFQADGSNGVLRCCVSGEEVRHIALYANLTTVTTAPLEQCVEEGSPPRCVVGIEVLTRANPSSAGISSLYSSEDRLFVAFESIDDYQGVFEALGSGRPVVTTQPCLRCSSNSSLFSKNEIRYVPFDHFYCRQCAVELAEKERVKVVSIVFSEEGSVFVGLQSVATKAYRIEQLNASALHEGPVPNGTIHQWCGHPNSIAVNCGLVAFSTGSCNPSVLVCSCVNPTQPSRVNTVQCLPHTEPAVLVSLTSLSHVVVVDTVATIWRLQPKPAMELRNFPQVRSESPSLLRVVSEPSDDSQLDSDVGDDSRPTTSSSRFPPPSTNSGGFQRCGSLQWSRSSTSETPTCVHTVTIGNKSLALVLGFASGGILVFDVPQKFLDGSHSLDIGSLSPSLELSKHRSSVTSMFTTKGRLFSAALDNSVHVWDVGVFRSAGGSGRDSAADVADVDVDFDNVIDPAVWKWRWTYTRLVKNDSDKKRKAVSQPVEFCERDGFFLYQFWILHRDVALESFNELSGGAMEFYSQSLESQLYVTCTETRDSEKVIDTFWEGRCTLSGREAVFQIHGMYSVMTGTRSFSVDREVQPSDRISAHESLPHETNDLLLLPGDVASLPLMVEGSSKGMGNRLRPLRLTLTIMALQKKMNPLSKAQPAFQSVSPMLERGTDSLPALPVLGIALLNRVMKEADSPNPFVKRYIEMVTKEKTDIPQDDAVIRSTLRTYEKKPWAVYRTVQPQDATIEVEVPCPWYAPSQQNGMLFLSNSSADRNSDAIVVSIAHNELSLDTVMTNPADLRALAALQPNELSKLKRWDIDEFRLGQFQRHECPVCGELPPVHPETDWKVPCIYRRCMKHPMLMCLEPHAHRQCVLCTQNFSQVNRRCCYACGRVVCFKCCKGRSLKMKIVPNNLLNSAVFYCRTKSPDESFVATIVKGLVSKAIEVNYPICVACDDEHCQRQLVKLEDAMRSLLMAAAALRTEGGKGDGQRRPQDAQDNSDDDPDEEHDLLLEKVLEDTIEGSAAAA